MDMSNKDMLDAFKDMRADYDMSLPSRYQRYRTGIPVGGGSADYNFRSEFRYYNSVELARDIERNDSIISVLIDRAVTNEIQGGFNLEVNTSDKSFNQAVLDRWLDWANDPDQCDVAQEMTFHEMEIHASRSEKLDGDCLIACLEDGSLQFFESHYIGTAQQMDGVVLGVKLDPFRKREGYYISPEIIDPNKTMIRGLDDSVKYYPTRDQNGMRQLFHVYNNRRVTQTRGVTVLAPIMQTISMLDDVQFATLLQRQIASAIVLIRNRSQFTGGMQNNVNYGEAGQETTPTGDVVNTDGLQMGMEITTQPGETIEAFQSTLPQDYFDQVRLLIQIISINLGLPLSLALLDASDTNYSGFRGAMSEARKGFRFNQQNLIRRLHDPLYKLKLTQFMAEDPALRKTATKLGKDAFSHIWTPQAFEYIDPQVEAQADIMQVRSGLTSPRRIQAKNGRRHDIVLQETLEDNMLAITKAKDAAQKINEEYPDDGTPVHWREIVSLPTPEGVQSGLIPAINKEADPDQVDGRENRTRQVGEDNPYD